jgi:2-oxoglutarate ferredoxin oxidoreductase subunit alpha
MAKTLMKGNEAIAKAAVAAGCDAYYGYPITPQSEVTEYMSKLMVDEGRAFVQAESELAAINMAYGAGAAGFNVMTASASPGIALKQEGISYAAGAEVPIVIASIARSGPGLGGIQPGQADYNQAVKGGGNGDYNIVVYGPKSIQETADYIQKSFVVAKKYRTPVMVLIDGAIGQMMEPVEIKDVKVEDIDTET